MNEFNTNSTQTNSNLQTEATLVNPLQKRVTVLYCIVGVLVFISIASLLMMLKTGTKNDDQNSIVAEKNELEMINVTPTLAQKLPPTVQPSTINQRPTPKSFNYNFMSPSEFVTKTRSFLIKNNPNGVANPDLDSLLAKSEMQYKSSDTFTKWVASLCPDNGRTLIQNQNMPFKIDSAYQLECGFSNVAFNPQLAVIDVVPIKTHIFDLNVMGKNGALDGMEPYGMNMEEVLMRWNSLINIQNTRFEIKSAGPSSLLFAYVNYGDYFAVARISLSQQQVDSMSNDLLHYPNIDNNNKSIIDQLLFAVEMVKPI